MTKPALNKKLLKELAKQYPSISEALQALNEKQGKAPTIEQIQFLSSLLPTPTAPEDTAHTAPTVSATTAFTLEDYGVKTALQGSVKSLPRIPLNSDGSLFFYQVPILDKLLFEANRQKANLLQESRRLKQRAEEIQDEVKTISMLISNTALKQYPDSADDLQNDCLEMLTNRSIFHGINGQPIPVELGQLVNRFVDNYLLAVEVKPNKELNENEKKARAYLDKQIMGSFCLTLDNLMLATDEATRAEIEDYLGAIRRLLPSACDIENNDNRAIDKLEYIALVGLIYPIAKGFITVGNNKSHKESIDTLKSIASSEGSSVDEIVASIGELLSDKQITDIATTIDNLPQGAFKNIMINMREALDRFSFSSESKRAGSSSSSSSSSWEELVELHGARKVAVACTEVANSGQLTPEETDELFELMKKGVNKGGQALELLPDWLLKRVIEKLKNN